jgi:adenine-specific DNA-methyltransferase
VYEANAEDSGKRRLVLIQLPEQVRSGGFKTIAEITKERLRRVGKRLRNERETQLGLSLGAVDLGFRVFKLDNSNIRAWDPRRDDIAGTLDEAVDHLKTDRSESDVLSELLLKLGLELTVPIEQKKIAGKTVYNIGVGTLLACLDTKIAAKDVEKLAHGIADWHKELAPAGETVVVFRDSAFADDVAKTNLTAILAQAREDRPMIVRSL